MNTDKTKLADLLIIVKNLLVVSFLGKCKPLRRWGETHRAQQHEVPNTKFEVNLSPKMCIVIVRRHEAEARLKRTKNQLLNTQNIRKNFLTFFVIELPN